MNDGKLPYNKPPLSFVDQAKLLIQRGLIADQDELTDFLRRTNYYRFSTYLFPFRHPGSDNFQPGTTLVTVCELYRFDQALRTLLFDGLGVIEIAMLRTHFVEFFTQQYGPFGYTDPANFNIHPDKHAKLLELIQLSVDRSREEFVRHFKRKYSDEFLPLWTAVETMSLGNMITMARNLHRKDMKSFAGEYGVAYIVMDSWLHSINYVRNVCAHHARLWNRALAIKPLIPDARHRPDFHTPPFLNSRVFAILTIVQYLLNVIDPGHRWNADVVALLARYPNIPVDQMGFPDRWQELPMWCK